MGVAFHLTKSLSRSLVEGGGRGKEKKKTTTRGVVIYIEDTMEDGEGEGRGCEWWNGRGDFGV